MNKVFIRFNINDCTLHNAIHNGEGIGLVVRLINGGYDCCPKSKYLY